MFYKGLAILALSENRKASSVTWNKSFIAKTVP